MKWHCLHSDGDGVESTGLINSEFPTLFSFSPLCLTQGNILDLFFLIVPHMEVGSHRRAMGTESECRPCVYTWCRSSTRPSPKSLVFRTRCRQERRLLKALYRKVTHAKQSSLRRASPGPGHGSKLGHQGACGSSVDSRCLLAPGANRMACGQNCACCSCGPAAPGSCRLGGLHSVLLSIHLWVSSSHIRPVSPSASGVQVWEAGLSLGTDLQGVLLSSSTSSVSWCHLLATVPSN